MNFDEYMKKIQIISNILLQKKYAEDVLNSKELNIAQDFQYICLSSASNYDLVNEVIARLAQNGNRNIVEENIKNISINMWKGLFDKNDAIKDIFIKNYNTILENAGIITFREIDRFIENDDTRALIYDNLGSIAKKLCTYDRASLIKSLKTKEHGVEKIKEHLESFFQKGEYDISTTYSKILIELNNIQGIESLDILIACNKYLTEMLSRETAIDNETNKLLNWIYDNFEETQMSDEQRAEIKKNIDKAILENFDHILDKSNYDRNTIKILKQFDCAREKFDKNKNHYIQKSIKTSHDTKIYDLNIEKNQMNKNINSYKKIDEIFENTKDEISKQSNVLHNIIRNPESNNNMDTIKPETVTPEDANKIETVAQTANSIPTLNFNEQNENDAIAIKEATSEIENQIVTFNNNESQASDVSAKKLQEENTAEEKKSEINPISEIIEAKDIIAEINSRVEAFNTQMNSTKKISDRKIDETQNQDSEKKVELSTSEAAEIIRSLANGHIYETEKIIDKVMKRNQSSEEKANEQTNIEQSQIIEKEINQELKDNTNQTINNNINELLEENGKQQSMPISEISTQKEINENTDTKALKENSTDQANYIQENKDTTLILKDDDQVFSVPENIFKRIWKKILKLLGFKSSVEKIGE